MLVGHIRFDTFTQDPDPHAGGSRDTETASFQMKVRTIDVSWIMTRVSLAPDRPEKIMRSMHFRGSLDLKCLSIPKNGAMFVTLFLGDVHDKWKCIIESAKLHLARIASRPCLQVYIWIERVLITAPCGFSSGQHS